ncbi:MAG: integrase core domain-containing protein [Planctomycetia bacterium]
MPYFGGRPYHAFLESFHSRVRQECLNAGSFLSLLNTKEKVEQLQYYCIKLHPHSSL